MSKLVQGPSTGSPKLLDLGLATRTWAQKKRNSVLNISYTCQLLDISLHWAGNCRFPTRPPWHWRRCSHFRPFPEKSADFSLNSLSCLITKQTKWKSRRWGFLSVVNIPWIQSYQGIISLILPSGYSIYPPGVMHRHGSAL